jgi:glycosyltransferase involved in cell wall biosynthesis
LRWLGSIGAGRLTRNFNRLINRHHHYPRSAGRLAHACDAFHVVDHSYAQVLHALPVNRAGVFCHDLDTFRCLLEPALEPRPKWFRAMARRTLRGLQKAAVVFHATAAVRADIQKHALIDPARLVHAPLGIADEFTPNLNRSAGAPGAVEPFGVLHVGSCIPRKRIDVLLNVFARLREIHPAARLLQIGGEWTAAQREIIDRHDLARSLDQQRGLDRVELARHYRNASLVAVTSEAEGFGLPVIEALACGASVLASDIPVLREVGGDAIDYAPVGQIDAWTEAASRLLTDATAAPPLSRRLARASLYSWAHHADVIAGAYERLLGQSPASNGGCA